MPDEIFEYKLKVTAEGGGGAATAADIEKANAAAKKCSDGFQDLNQEKGNAVQADKEIVKGAAAVEEADRKALLSKREMRAAVHGLSEQFPVLARVGMMAIHPIGLAVAAAAGAFAIFRARVDEATRAMSQAELPDISPAKVGQVTAMAEAYEKFKTALDGTLKVYNSVEAASKRRVAQMEAEFKQQQKMLAAQKGLELANLEAGKSGMSGADYEKSKLGIEERYERAGIKAEQNKTEMGIYLKQEEAMDLRKDAAKKLTEQAKIHVATAKQDEDTEAKMKADSDAAEKNIAEHREQIGKFLMLKAGEFGLADIGTKFMTRLSVQAITGRGAYGAAPSDADIDEAIAVERGTIAGSQATVDRYKAFGDRKAARDASRKRKSDLNVESGAELGRAGVLDAEANDESAAAAGEFGQNRKIGSMNAKARVLEALAKAKQEEIQTLDEIHGLVTRNAGVSETLRQKVIDLEKLVTSLEARMTQPF